MCTVSLNSLIALSYIHVVGLIPQVGRQPLDPAARAWSILQPLQSFLQKALDPLVDKAAADANRDGNVGDRRTVSQEQHNPGAPGQASRDVERTLPRPQCLALHRRETNCEGGFTSTRHTDPFQK